jgi:spectinomycin phosphotransferase
MLEEPGIRHTVITGSVQVSFGIETRALAFLPLGADLNTAVYRLEAADGRAYFLKLRRGAFAEISVRLPAYLHQQGLRQVIPPLPARSGQLWAAMGAYKLILYPYIEGLDAYQKSLSERQWVEFGATVKSLHNTQLPAQLVHQVPREDFNPRGRNRVKGFQAQVETDSFSDPSAARLAELMRQKAPEITALVSRAERLASELQARQIEMVLCHSDLHAGNLHLAPGGELYIVDWDNPILAPREHDLMHIGASARWNGKRIKGLFYRGYGAVQLDGMALAYYRCERVVQDIAEFCRLLLSSTQGGSDREQHLGYFTRQFDPGQEVEIALRGGDEKQVRYYGCFKPRERG